MKAGAVILLWDGDDLGLMLRDNRPDIPFPCYWSLFGGWLEPAETALDAIRRELFEELNLRIPVQYLAFLGIHFVSTHLSPYRERIHINVFSARLSDCLGQLSLSEGQSYSFFAVPLDGSLKIIPYHRSLIERFAYPGVGND